MKFVFEFYRLLHRFNYEFNINILERNAQYLIDMKFSHPTELISNQLVDLPVSRKQILVSIGGLLNCAFKPREPSLGLVKCRIWLSWGKQFFVRVQNKLTIPTAKVVECLSTDGVHHQTSLLKFIFHPITLHAAEVFDYLKP